MMPVRLWSALRVLSRARSDCGCSLAQSSVKRSMILTTRTKAPLLFCNSSIHMSQLCKVEARSGWFSQVSREFRTSTGCYSVRELQKEKSSNWDSGFILLVIPALCTCLGVWQVRRRSWKLKLIEEMEAKTQATPVPLPTDAEVAAQLEYQRVLVEGEFDHSREFFVGPRQMIVPDDQRRGSIMTSGSTSGVHVITPLRLHTGQEVLVNRGWVSHKNIDASTRAEGQVKGEVKFTGVLRKTEQRQPFQPRLQETSTMTFRRDIDFLSEKLGTSPIFVDADAASTVRDGPVGGQTRVTLRNEHFSYILTWFTLAGATSWMWYRRYGAIAMRR